MCRLLTAVAFFYCEVQALGAGASAAVAHGLLSVQPQQLWRTGLVAPQHVGSSQTRARTRVPCIGRRILNHCATREALKYSFAQCYSFKSYSKKKSYPECVGSFDKLLSPSYVDFVHIICNVDSTKNLNA